MTESNMNNSRRFLPGELCLARETLYKSVFRTDETILGILKHDTVVVFLCFSPTLNDDGMPASDFIDIALVVAPGNIVAWVAFDSLKKL